MSARAPSCGDASAWTPPRVTVGYDEAVTGRGALPNRIAKMVSHALARARERGQSREDVAEAMSAHLGRTVSLHMLNKYSAEGSEEHRIPLEAFAALVHATGDHELLGWLPALFGFATVPGRYRDVIELHLIEEHERVLAERKRAVRACLEGSPA